MEKVEVHGLHIAYERAGSGPVLVLLHGYVGDGPTTWRRQLDALSAEFTVVAWDAPGAGRSTDVLERQPAPVGEPDLARSDLLHRDIEDAFNLQPLEEHPSGGLFAASARSLQERPGRGRGRLKLAAPSIARSG